MCQTHLPDPHPTTVVPRLWYGMAWHGLAWYYSMVWYGMAWHSVVLQYGMAWHGVVLLNGICMVCRGNRPASLGQNTPLQHPEGNRNPLRGGGCHGPQACTWCFAAVSLKLVLGSHCQKNSSVPLTSRGFWGPHTITGQQWQLLQLFPDDTAPVKHC